MGYVSHKHGLVYGNSLYTINHGGGTKDFKYALWIPEPASGFKSFSTLNYSIQTYAQQLLFQPRRVVFPVIVSNLADEHWTRPMTIYELRPFWYRWITHHVTTDWAVSSNYPFFNEQPGLYFNRRKDVLAVIRKVCEQLEMG